MMHDLLDTYDISLIHPANADIKASIAERVNRTLKDPLFEYMNDHNTVNWHKVLQQFTDAYNRKPHQTLNNRAPNDIKSDDVNALQRRLYPDLFKSSDQLNRNELKIGSFVRIVHDRTAFQRGFKAAFSNELYKIRYVRHKVASSIGKQGGGVVTIYKLESHPDGHLLRRMYYRAQLSPVVMNDNIL